MPTPTIAILIGREPEHRYSVFRGYVDALWTAGAVPVIVTAPPVGAPGDAWDALVERVASCDGLLLSGGGDVDPAAYGEIPRVPLMDVDGARDRAELLLAQSMRAAGRPILGICRGIQVLAVASGGSLHQDVVVAGYAGHWEEERQFEPVHAVHAEPASAASRALGGTMKVNSIHHQAVRDPGDGLACTAWSDDGLIEAVEGDGVLGLQWHPERLCGQDPRHLAPFEWLVEAAA